MFDAAKHVYDQVTDFMLDDIYISIDYGTQNATVFLLWRKGKDGIWYCTKEFYYSGRDEKKQKTDKEFADELEEFTKDFKIKKIIVDPSVKDHLLRS